MKIALGLGLMAVSLVLAVYNVKKHERNEITGPTLTLLFSAFAGLALILDLNFQLLGFDSSKLTNELKEKVTEAKNAKDEANAAKNEANKAKLEAEKAQRLAQDALRQSREVYAIGLARTGMLPSEASAIKDQKEAKAILQEVYKEDYSKKIKTLMDQHVLPRDFKP